MKPRLRYCVDHWICVMGTLFGTGPTPRAAFHAWGESYARSLGREMLGVWRDQRGAVR